MDPVPPVLADDFPLRGATGEHKVRPCRISVNVPQRSMCGQGGSPDG